MITISNAELKDFFKRSAGITQTGLIPIAKFIKIAVTGGSAIIYETDDKSVWMTHKVDCMADKDTEILLHKETLEAFVNKSRDAVTNIVDFIGKITLQDANQKMNCPTQPVNLFSKMPGPGNVEKHAISTELLDNIAIAKHYISDDPKLSGMNNWEVLYIWSEGKKTSICGCFAGNYLYHTSFELGGIELMLYRPNCNMLVNYSEGSFYTVGNQVFFDFGKTVLGFTKPEYKRAQFEFIFSQLNKEHRCEVDRRSIIDFCELVEALKLSTIYNEVTLKNIDAYQIGLFYSNKEKEMSGERLLSVDKNYDMSTMNFNTKTLLNLLTPLQFETINLSLGARRGMLMITSSEDPNYIGTIMALAAM